MEDTFTILLATSVGAGISLLAQYIVESKRSRNEKFKFSYEKMVSIGERHYEFSGVALLVFESILNKFQNLHEFESAEAHLVYEGAVEIMAEHNKSLLSRTHTITSADIYFKISKIEVAKEMIRKFNFEIATLLEITTGNDPEKELKERGVIERLIKLLQGNIALINSDREIIANSIRNLITMKL